MPRQNTRGDFRLKLEKSEDSMSDIAYAMGTAPQAAGQPAPNPIISLLPLVLIFVIFYFMLIRPQQKRQKEHQNLIKNIKKNDDVVTTGGLHGTIVAVKDDTFMIRVSEGVNIEIDRTCVAYVKKSHG